MYDEQGQWLLITSDQHPCFMIMVSVDNTSGPAPQRKESVTLQYALSSKEEKSSCILKRFYILAGNPVKEILLKLNLPDHRKLKDGGVPDSSCLTRFITTCSYPTDKHKDIMKAQFAMTHLGPLNHFLGISALRTTSSIFLSQTKYATEILEQAQMLNCNPSRTPIDTEKKLGPEGSSVTDPTLYRSLVGSLQYLTFTRPDLSYAVQPLCLYMHDPREPHLNAMKCVLRYLRGTTDLGLQLFRSTTSQLIAYSDADWAGCPAMRRSTSGYCVFLGDNLLTWSSKCQDTLSHSSVEAEYRGVANAVAKTSWILNLLHELHTPLSTATLVYCDNVSAVCMSANPVQHQCTKHIEIDIHFVCDKVAAGYVRVLHVPSRFQYADIFTKGLPYPLFVDFRPV
ncbi:ribonuclease H-like domain-containing protein [Tanacetum coccineum]